MLSCIVVPRQAISQVLHLLEEQPSVEFLQDMQSQLVDADESEESFRAPGQQTDFALVFVGESTPWTAWGLHYSSATPDRYQFGRLLTAWYLTVGSGIFRQPELKNNGEQLNLRVATNAANAGLVHPVTRRFSLRSGVGMASFSGSFTQRGADVGSNAAAGDLLGSGFAGKSLYLTLSGVLGWDLKSYRVEFVPVGFRFPLWSKFRHDTATPHESGVNRHLGGSNVFGLVNFGVGVRF